MILQPECQQSTYRLDGLLYLGDICCANTAGFGTFPGFCELLVQCVKISSRWVVVVGLQESHLQWYGLELGSDPPSPLCTTDWTWGGKRARVFPRGKPVVFDSRVAEGTSVAPVNVRALEVLTPSAVALSRSAVPLGGCLVSLYVPVLCCVGVASKEARTSCVACWVYKGGTLPSHPSMRHHNMHGIIRQSSSENDLHPDKSCSRKSA